MNRPKQQGTAWETAVVNAARHAGHAAYRIAEGGTSDLGDIRITTVAGRVIIVEAKNAGALNIHDALAKARGKAAGFADLTVVAWKRLTRKNGNTRRTQAGPPIVAMTLDDFLDLL